MSNAKLMLILRFLFVRNVFDDDSNPFLTFSCFFGFFLRTCFCVSICVVRIISLYKISFLEETLGEFGSRMILIFASVSSGILLDIIVLIEEENLPGCLLKHSREKMIRFGKKSNKNIYKSNPEE
jgi:hypothetical protein